MKRREFVAATAAAAAVSLNAAETSQPAVLGGAPIRTQKFPAWPIAAEQEEQALLAVLRGKRWNRNAAVARFEKTYASLTGAKHCLAVANGTASLITSLGVLGIGPGDEVIVPPYTFVATINAVLLYGAMPVFVDTDPETFQIDHRKIEAAITPRTVAIVPVHLGGGSFHVDAVLEIAKKHRLPVIEDACQSHLAEWKGRKVGSYGTTGCFSFQASKNLNCGEGGALITSDDDFIEKAFAFHNNGRPGSSARFSYGSPGANLRLTEFQGALLLSQMSRLEQQARTRETNAAYLTSMLREIPGIAPAKTPEGCTRNAYHLYMLRYDAAHFAGMDRAGFLKALNAEGIPGDDGYEPLNRESFIRAKLTDRGGARVYSKDRMREWDERNVLPENDKVCREAVWFTQTMLLGPRADMDQIAGAIRRIQKQAGAIKARLA